MPLPLPVQPRIKVLVVDDVEATCESLCRLLSFEPDIEVVGYALSGEAALARCRELWPDVLLLDVNLGHEDADGFAITRDINAEFPWIGVILMSMQADEDYLRRAMMAGARQYLRKPFDSREMTSAIRHVYALEAGKRQVAAMAAHAVAYGHGPASDVPQRGLVTAVVSPRGGAGKTTVSVNLALALKSITGKRVVLVDADFIFGDVDAHLNLTGKRRRSILDVSEGVARVDHRNHVDHVDHVDNRGHRSDQVEHVEEDLLENCLVQHRSGVMTLLAPGNPERGETVEVALLPAILRGLSALYDYVIVDTGPQFAEAVLTTLDAADLILLVTTMDVASLRAAALYLEATGHAQLGYAQRTRVVLNRAGERGRDGMRVQAVESTLKVPVPYSLSHAAEAAFKELNEGLPVVEGARNHQFSRDVAVMAESISALWHESKEGAGRPVGAPATPYVSFTPGSRAGGAGGAGGRGGGGEIRLVSTTVSGAMETLSDINSENTPGANGTNGAGAGGKSAAKTSGLLGKFKGLRRSVLAEGNR